MKEKPVKVRFAPIFANLRRVKVFVAFTISEWVRRALFRRLFRNAMNITGVEVPSVK